MYFLRITNTPKAHTEQSEHEVITTNNAMLQVFEKALTCDSVWMSSVSSSSESVTLIVMLDEEVYKEDEVLEEEDADGREELEEDPFFEEDEAELDDSLLLAFAAILYLEFTIL